MGRAVLLAALVSAIACGELTGPRDIERHQSTPTPGGTRNPSTAFTVVDADRILPHFDEPPSGFHQTDTASGRPVLTRPYHGDETCEGAPLPERNFVGGESIAFERDRIGDPTFQFLGSNAMVFSDASSASAALVAFTNCFRGPSWFSGQSPGDPKLGAESVIFTGSRRIRGPDWLSELNVQSVLYMWRVNNLLLNVLLEGPSVDWHDAEAVARLMDTRTQ